MKSSFIRNSVVAGLAGMAGLALAACSPSLEVDSSEKVATATGFQQPSASASATGTAAATTTAVAAAGAPSFIDCVAAPTQNPTEVSLSCADDTDSLVEIQWTQWGVQEATGTGDRETVDPATGETTVDEDIEIVLTTPIESPQGLVFSQITVDGELVTP